MLGSSWVGGQAFPVLSHSTVILNRASLPWCFLAPSLLAVGPGLALCYGLVRFFRPLCYSRHLYIYCFWYFVLISLWIWNRLPSVSIWAFLECGSVGYTSSLRACCLCGRSFWQRVHWACAVVLFSVAVLLCSVMFCWSAVSSLSEFFITSILLFIFRTCFFYI